MNYSYAQKESQHTVEQQITNHLIKHRYKMIPLRLNFKTRKLYLLLNIYYIIAYGYITLLLYVIKL